MMRAALILASLASLASLAGCAGKPLANRISCTAAGDAVFISSMWGPVGIASQADSEDARAIIAAGCGSREKQISLR